MSTKGKAIPEGYHSVTPYLYLKNAAAAIDFYKRAFGAVELVRMPQPDGRIGHAEIRIGDSMVMLADEFQEINALGPSSRGGATASYVLYVEDVDAAAARAVEAGAKVIREVKDQFYGDRSGTLEDPFGHVWTIATHMEDLTAEEMKSRAPK